MQKDPLTISPGLISKHETELIGSAAQTRAIDLPGAIRLVAAREEGWADVAPTVLPLDEVLESGIKPLAECRAVAVKTLVDPSGSGRRPYSRATGTAR